MSGFSIQNLTLWDYRCFQHLEIDFHPQMTVLVAANGCGKTSILDAIAIAYGPFIGAFDEAAGKHFAPSDIRVSPVRRTLTNEMEDSPEGVRLDAAGWLPFEPIEAIKADFGAKHILEEYSVKWKRARSNSTKARSTVRDASELVSFGKVLQRWVRTPGKSVVLPLIAYYGTGRLWQQKKLAVGKLERTSRTVGYADCLDYASNYNSFIRWFHYWYINSRNEQLKALETGGPVQETEFDGYIASVRRAVDICLKPVGWHSLSYSLSKGGLVARNDQQGELLVEWLSDGIRNMIAMVADIAFRATKLNSPMGADASRLTPGIVLIDEVDMHLHPAWQQTILQSLTEAFPLIQFIVTTHSPQVLTTVLADCIRILNVETDQKTGSVVASVRKVYEQTRGVASADLLARIMGVGTIPDVPEAGWVSDYHALIEQNLHGEPDGIVLRQKLEMHFGVQHPVLLECDRMIRLQQFKQRLPRHLGAAGH